MGHLLSVDHPDGQGGDLRRPLDRATLDRIGAGLESDGGGIPMRRATSRAEQLATAQTIAALFAANDTIAAEALQNASIANNSFQTCASPLTGVVLGVAEFVNETAMFKYALTTGDAPRGGAQVCCGVITQ